MLFGARLLGGLEHSRECTLSDWLYAHKQSKFEKQRSGTRQETHAEQNGCEQTAKA